MNLSYIVSCAITGTLSFLLGIFVYLRNRSSNVNRICMLLSLSVSLWSWSILGRELSFEKSTGLFWVRLSYVGAVFIPAFFLHFVNSLLKLEKNRLVLFSYILSLIFLVFDLTPLFIKDVGSILSFRHYGIPGVAYPFYAASFIGIIGYSHYVLAKYLRKSEGQTRNQIRYLLLAAIIGFLGGVSTFLPNFNIEVFPFGFYLISVYVLIISYAIVKHRLMDINVVLKKGTSYVFLMLLLFIPSFLLMVFTQRIFFGEINYLFSAVIFLMLLLATKFYYVMKPKTEKAIEQLLFKDRYDYRDTLAKFSKAMVTILDLKSLSKKIIETITQTMGVEKASLFSLSEERGGYYLLESKNIKIASFPPVLSKGDPLPQYLQKIKEIVIREELLKGATIAEINDVVNTMSRLEAEVSIPLISKGQLIGMINLSYKLNKDIYSHEDIELLSTLANQTTVAIENARLYDDLKKSKSYIRRADRLASLGTLTAGLAHEIRNPLVAIKTFTQLLPERIDDDEFRNHFLSIASGEVDRISALVTELLEFARPSEPNFELEDINTILDGMILLVSTETKSKRIDIVKDYASDLSPITIDREQMKQVFLNMLLNAIEATPENGKIYVKTRSYAKPEGDPYIQIEFTDTGCGIRQEYLEDIFTPFFTTKEKGSGLGLSISNQIV
ncbi:MAG: ATP-binding protein, partial [Candidatus Helarchaeota archaeon]|nr:ATP-binding protein [Candidatus Helarchaeota archaeon]